MRRNTHTFIAQDGVRFRLIEPPMTRVSRIGKWLVPFRDLSAESEACPLRLPVQRKAFLETVERQGGGYLAVGDGLLNVEQDQRLDRPEP